MPKFRDIPQFPTIHYVVDVSFYDLPGQIDKYVHDYGLELNPDFQRGHVWNTEQQRLFVEFMLSGGESGRNIFFNHPGWMGSFAGDFVCVDGLQRITAMLRFLEDRLKVFGYYYSEYEDSLGFTSGFKFHIAKLQTRAEVLQWYIQFNTGGTVHTTAEINRVKELLKQEQY